MKHFALKITLVLTVLAIAASLLVPVASADPVKKGPPKTHRLDTGFDEMIGALQPLLSLFPALTTHGASRSEHKAPGEPGAVPRYCLSRESGCSLGNGRSHSRTGGHL